MSAGGGATAALVTVLMPIHNGEAFVAEAVESILGQSLGDFEFLIIDDGSTDRSTQIAEASGDSRIRVLRNERQIGLVRTLNRGLESARGKYVARMDADDVSLPQRLERQVAFMERNPEVGVCGTRVITIGDREGEIWSYPESAEEIRCRLLFGASIAHPSVCMRREAFLRHGLRFDDAYPHAEDYKLWKTASEQFPLANLGEVLLRYRIHAGSVSRQCHPEQQATVRRIHREALAALGLTPREDELFVHRNVASGGASAEALHFRAIDSWLDRLRRANLARGTYQREAFERQLGRYWLAAAYRTLERGRLEPARFLFSPLARCVSFEQRIRWAAHALKRSLRLGSQFPSAYR